MIAILFCSSQIIHCYIASDLPFSLHLSPSFCSLSVSLTCCSVAQKHSMLCHSVAPCSELHPASECDVNDMMCCSVLIFVLSHWLLLPLQGGFCIGQRCYQDDKKSVQAAAICCFKSVTNSVQLECNC